MNFKYFSAITHSVNDSISFSDGNTKQVKHATQIKIYVVYEESTGQARRDSIGKKICSVETESIRSSTWLYQVEKFPSVCMTSRWKFILVAEPILSPYGRKQHDRKVNRFGVLNSSSCAMCWLNMA